MECHVRVLWGIIKLPILGRYEKLDATNMVVLRNFPYFFVHEVWVGVNILIGKMVVPLGWHP